MLSQFDALLVQNQQSAALCRQLTLSHTTVHIIGDTRFDRVAAVALAPGNLHVTLQHFIGSCPVAVAGSTWPPDEALLLEACCQQWFPSGGKLILVPHEVDATHLEQIERRWADTPYRLLRYSQLSDCSLAQCSDASVLLVDTIGLLSALYRVGQWAYVGGGFGKGLHNTLEAAVYGIPVVFGGTHWHKFVEASELLELGGAHCVTRAQQLCSLLLQWQQHPQLLNDAGLSAKAYVLQRTGATASTVQILEQRRWLPDG